VFYSDFTIPSRIPFARESLDRYSSFIEVSTNATVSSHRGSRGIAGKQLFPRGRTCALIALAASFMLPVAIRAQVTLYWDTNGTAPGATNGTTANGTWGTDNFWNTNSAGIITTPGPWVSGDIAAFAAGTNTTAASTVAVNGTIAGVAGLIFKNGQGPFTLTGGTLTLTGTPSIEVDATTATISSALAGTVGFTKTGTGTLVLSGSGTYTGATNINSGVLSVQNAGALGTAANASNTTVANGATLQLANNTSTTNTGALILSGTGMGGSGALQSIGGNNTWNGSIVLASNATIVSATAGNVLTIDANYQTALTATMGNNTLTIDGPGDTWFNANVGVPGDTGGLIKNGTGALTFYGYNTYYTGATLVNQGSLELVVGPFSSGWYGINGSLTIGTGSLTSTAKVDIWGASNPSGSSYADQISPASAVTINSDGALNVGASTSTGSLTLNGGQVNISSGQMVTAYGDITSNVNGAHQTSLISGGALTLNTGNINVARDSTLASDLTISSAIGGANLNKNGNGILTLSGANNYTGNTNINAGTLTLGAANALPTNTAVTVANAATFNLNNYAATVGSLAGSGTVTLGSGTLNAGGNNASTTFSGSFTGTDTGTFEKSGTGTLTFGAGMNAPNATLELNGGTLNLGGFKSTFGILNVNASSVIDFNGASGSVLDILNAVVIGAGAILTINDWVNGVDYFYSLQNPGATTLGRITFTGFSGNATNWQSFDSEITPVPEPATCGALMLGLSTMFAVWRHFRRRTS
jgi:fibronectin-binding autotransporter adhesin